MTDYSEFIGLAGFPVVAALVQVFKPWLPDERWHPIASLALGVIINVVIAYQLRSDLVLAVLVGIVTGLAASGLYSGGKAIAGA